MKFAATAGWLPKPKDRDLGWKEVPAAASTDLSCLESRPSSTAALSFVLIALTLALLLPTEFSLRVGPLRLSIYRLLLIASFFPALVLWIQGRAGRITAVDGAVVGFGLWGWAALAVNGGLGSSIEPGGILLLESFGAYLVGRVWVRDMVSWSRWSALVVIASVASLVMTLPEMLTGKRLVHDTVGALLPGAPNFTVEPRFGLTRAFGTFDHPILNGVFASTCLSLAWFAAGSVRQRCTRSLLVAASAMTSLSSGALLSMAVQAVLAGYRYLTRAVPFRWQLLVGSLLAVYGLVTLFSSRSGLQVLIWYLAFDRTTSSYRLLIWEHGGANVTTHPWFGLGQGDWDRPEWMSASVDSFWLLTAMMYGLPALGLLAFAVLFSLAQAGSRIRGDAAIDRARTSWILAWVALVFAGFTVHYWNSVFAFLWLLLGAGAWMRHDDDDTKERAP